MADDPRELFATNKTIPDNLREVILDALSFYPALHDVKIDFKYAAKIRTHFMQAQPRYTTMIGSRRRRSYIIKIRPQFILKGKEIPAHKLPRDVLVGWIGHELGHIMDYLRKTNLELLIFGIGYYTSKSFIITAERAADTYALNHGLGDYILAAKNFILHMAEMPERYIERMNRLYLPPEEIMIMMDDILAEAD
jgi:hypothetical protein